MAARGSLALLCLALALPALCLAKNSKPPSAPTLGACPTAGTCESASSIRAFPVPVGYLQRFQGVEDAATCAGLCAGVAGSTYYEYTIRQSPVISGLGLGGLGVARLTADCHCYSQCLNVPINLPVFPMGPLQFLAANVTGGFQCSCDGITCT